MTAHSSETVIFPLSIWALSLSFFDDFRLELFSDLFLSAPLLETPVPAGPFALPPSASATALVTDGTEVAAATTPA
eukprot:CAMPEP_0182553740 /NCGR_PEP_ID=MMETSP1323-20130603/49635_1 /TAXON_ID=236787 /ORGANISM="Florenciella parvula, Strain RCC1693" /LENGTH=75 /DNA_ID=CAMNT_0024765459 /DNA_START=1102 /DNA_END=1327 /DNA_ORIENTATION=+